jgi:hypothetical protein
MDDKQWIKHLQGGMTDAGWTPVGPDQSGDGWITGAVRFETGSTHATGPTGFGKTPIAAVEDLYQRVVGDLPHRPEPTGAREASDQGFDGVPDSDIPGLTEISHDFHRHGYALRWFHPTSSNWIMQWTAHSGDVTPVYGQTQDVGEYRGLDMSALEAARRAWAKFQAARGGG